jgi:hypothetical protein
MDVGARAAVDPDAHGRRGSGLFARITQTIKRSPRKAVVAIATSIVTGALGLLFGIVGNDAHDYQARADDCYNSLSDSNTDLASLPYDLVLAQSPDYSVTEADQHSAIDRINRYKRASDAVESKCPVNGNTRYLKHDDVARYEQAWAALDKCLTTGSGCNYDQVLQLTHGVSGPADTLMDQSNDVKNWSVFKQAVEAFGRLF